MPVVGNDFTLELKKAHRLFIEKHAQILTIYVVKVDLLTQLFSIQL